MSKCINGENKENLFYFKEYIDNEKLISKIVTNIESKIKLVENYKNKYYLSNNILENVIMTKIEFLEIINEFEETISQSLQGMKSLIVEIRNLKDKKEVEEVEDKIFIKKNNIIKNKNNKNNELSNILNNLCYDYSKDKNYSEYLDEFKNQNNKEILNKGKNKSFCEPKELSLYTHLYGFKNNLNLSNKFNGTKNKLYYKKHTYYSSKKIPSICIKKIINNKINNNNNNNVELENKNTNENLLKLINNRNEGLKQNKTYKKKKKTISNDSITEKDKLTYDLSILNDYQNQSSSSFINNNNNNNDIKSFNNEPKTNMYRRILRLQLKNKNNNNNLNNNNNINNNNISNRNNSFSQKYELELQNTNQEKNEKIEVEIKCPIRQGIRQNCRKKSLKNDENSKKNIINRFNYNKNKIKIIEKINNNEKLRNYFAKKYGGNKYDIFLNKLWRNKFNINDINHEVNIISVVIDKEEKMEKLKSKEKKLLEENNNNKTLYHKQNYSEYEFKYLTKTPIQNIINKEENNGSKNFRTITPYKNINNKYL